MGAPHDSSQLLCCHHEQPYFWGRCPHLCEITKDIIRTIIDPYDHNFPLVHQIITICKHRLLGIQKFISGGFFDSKVVTTAEIVPVLPLIYV